LRINADSERNFVRFLTGDSEHCFSERELTDPILRLRSRQLITAAMPQALGKMAINDKLAQLQSELKKARGVSAEKEAMVARLLVQAAHPAVIEILLRENAEIFVSYSHNVGDLMAMHFWDTHGTASGLQSTGRQGAAVFVSCGGDPFFSGDQAHKTYETDGFPALARMLVIAGQELGHFADLLRHPDHGIIGRFSAYMDDLQPSKISKAARDSDMLHVENLQQLALKYGLAGLRRAERNLQFYSKRWKYSLPWLFCQVWRMLALAMWLLRRPKIMPRYIRTIPKFMHGEFIETMLRDMAFNLAPEADVYRSDNPQHEEAIACIEAFARVPQQVNKFGHLATARCTPKLYNAYYNMMIPGLLQNLPADLRAIYSKPISLSRGQLLYVRLRRMVLGKKLHSQLDNNKLPSREI
jgi:hypothetical protein